MPTANDVLAIAAGEIGYSRWDDPNQGTKYGRWYAGYTGDSYYGTNGVPYCAMFTSWVLFNAGVSAEGLPGAYVPWILSANRDAGSLVYNEDALPGDLVMFDWNHDGVADHIGLVEVNHPDEGWMQTVEGNGLPLDTPVLTPKGWVAIGDLSIDDEVIDPYGEPSKVSGIYPQGIRPCYEMTFSDGRSIVADECHRWKVRRNNGGKWIVATTKELIELIQKHRGIVCERITQPVGYSDKPELLVDPWVVGMLIGDGCLTRKRAAIANSDQQMIDQLVAKVGKPKHIWRKDNSKYGYVDGFMLEWGEAFTNQVKAIGLMGKSWKDKTIPDEYLMASIDDRIALLQGIMDSDGTCDKEGRAAFCTGNLDLAIQVRDLVFSLGGHCSIYTRSPIYTKLSTGEKKRGSLSFRVSNISLDFNPFTKTFKAGRYKVKHCRKGYKVNSIEPVKPQETVCISVTAPSELYIAGDWIVTHNTSSGTSGSQSNGGGVYRRARNYSSIIGVARPYYNEDSGDDDEMTEEQANWLWTCMNQLTSGYDPTGRDVNMNDHDHLKWIAAKQAKMEAKLDAICEALNLDPSAIEEKK